MRDKKAFICIFCLTLLLSTGKVHAQCGNDTIRVGLIMYEGKAAPMVLLPEFSCVGKIINQEERNRINKLRNEVYATYPYALTAAAILKDVNANLDRMPDRRSRKRYLKEIDRQLDAAFKTPLKNMSIDQGHVLIKLIDRQTGQNCYSIIKELKGGLQAMMWQSVGVFFNNNLSREYDPEDRDKDIEKIVKEMEASNVYRYQLYQQEALMRKVAKP